jgi:DNA adenine methylase
MSDESSYYGGKGGAGVWQTIVNRIPPHDCLVVPFAGHCAISRNIRPCGRLVLCDADGAVCRWWRKRLPDGAEIHNCDGVEFLRYHFGLTAAGVAGSSDAGSGGRVLGFESSRVVIYCDPPYHPETLLSENRYRHAFSADRHAELLRVLRLVPSRCLLSGYRHAMYDDVLSGWVRSDFQSMTRGGVRTESLWQNFAPGELHDWRYFGRDKREREKLRRRELSAIGKLRAMPENERRRLLAALAAEFGDPAGPPQSASAAVAAAFGDVVPQSAIASR